MSLNELIAKLEEMRDEVGGDTEVKLAMQPSWPFEYSIGQVVASQTFDEDDFEEGEAPRDGSVTIFIGEGEQLGYLAGSVSRDLGWK